MSGPLFEVRITDGATRDLEEIVDFVARNPSTHVDDKLLDDLLTLIGTLERFPFRGSTPRELEDLGMTQFRQVVFSYYRVIYLVVEQTVFISLIADGRRDMQDLLQRRLLRP
jgi:toxin ParE1/3/4